MEMTLKWMVQVSSVTRNSGQRKYLGGHLPCAGELLVPRREDCEDIVRCSSVVRAPVKRVCFYVGESHRCGGCGVSLEGVFTP